jgi:hypothetical protein
MDHESEPRSASSGGVLQHLQVASDLPKATSRIRPINSPMLTGLLVPSSLRSI